MEQPSIKEVPAENPRAPATMTLDEFLRPTFRVRGLIEAEPVVAAQSAQSKAVIGDLQNGYGFRRVRLGAQGSIGDSARWVSEVELAGGNVQFLDVFIGLTALPVVRELRVGYFREPFSLEGMTGVPFLTFMERSPLNPLDPARNWGIAGYWWPDSERTVLAFGMFRDGTNSAGLSQGDQDAWAYTTRFTGLPIYEPGDDNFRLVHLGMALSQRNPNNGVVSFNPGSGLSLLAVVDNPAIPFLPAVAIPASTQQLYNLQAAYVRGPLSVQSEWFGTTIQQIDAGVVFLHGFYAQASYFLTGEHRGYDRTRGAFSQVKVHHPVIRTRDVPGGGCGAFEVAARYSFYNFSSSNLPPAMDGTSSRALLRQMELEMNWYLNDNTRIMFNYTLPFVDKVDRVATSANVFGIRAALYW
ncbi:MAG: hypothetical protein K8T89_19600 [Planctomycetes bacterium]|nr:hypothetical protein [Planctomycetota bacterium]